MRLLHVLRKADSTPDISSIFHAISELLQSIPGEPEIVRVFCRLRTANSLLHLTPILYRRNLYQRKSSGVSIFSCSDISGCILQLFQQSSFDLSFYLLIFILASFDTLFMITDLTLTVALLIFEKLLKACTYAIPYTMLASRYSIRGILLVSQNTDRKERNLSQLLLTCVLY